MESVSDVPQPGDPGWPFGPNFDLTQMMQAMQGWLASEGPVNWEVAHQVAGMVAVADPETGAIGAEPSWGAADADRIVDLARVAQTHVGDATGLVAVHAAPVRVVGRREWASATLRDLRPVVEALAVALRPGGSGEPGGPGGADSAPGGEAVPPDALAAMGLPLGEEPLAGLMAALAPLLLGAQAGSMAGYLSQFALGRYDLSLPLDAEPEIAFVIANVDTFTREWSLARDDVYFSVALRETVRAAQRSVQWVRRGLVDRAVRFVSGYRSDASGIDDRFGDLDLSDPASLTDQLGDPSALLGMLRTPEQDALLDDIQRFVAVVEGYTDVVVAEIGGRLIGSHDQVDEALRRRRLERGEAAAFAEQMLGLELTREHFERGQRFCAGVVERAGLEGLNRLWEAPAMVPTPAELDAPGLWLARIDLPDAPPGP
jgi:putative hydrolase